ncbi:MAG TPA: DUF2721 domain-containing protein [Steroidobacteraceae bacterium]|nr:DUF2721 domain-containing protein [Steroidobacteraceae bacterium]
MAAELGLQITEVGEVVRLAVAPVFLLSGVGVTLTLRARLLGRAIALCTICALLVSMVVVALFLGALFDFRLSLTIAILFIVAMLSFIGGLSLFLREVFVATRSLRIGLRAAGMRANS